jgi:hypothetical protein
MLLSLTCHPSGEERVGYTYVYPQIEYMNYINEVAESSHMTSYMHSQGDKAS